MSLQGTQRTGLLPVRIPTPLPHRGGLFFQEFTMNRRAESSPSPRPRLNMEISQGLMNQLKRLAGQCHKDIPTTVRSLLWIGIGSMDLSTAREAPRKPHTS